MIRRRIEEENTSTSSITSSNNSSISMMPLEKRQRLDGDLLSNKHLQSRVVPETITDLTDLVEHIEKSLQADSTTHLLKKKDLQEILQ
jgi:hypothetical protein